MPLAETININGYLFKFISDSGVALPAEHLDHFNELRYREALEFALAIFPDFADFGKSQEYDQEYTPVDRNVDEKYREFRQRMIQKFLQWNSEYLHKCWERDVRYRQEARERLKQKKVNPGYLYLLVCGNGLHKIGVTAHPTSRLAAFKNSMPFQKDMVKYEHLMKVDDMVGLETRLHNQYAKKRVAGEWFNLDDDDIAYIKSLAVHHDH